jgi:hypothetical protein
MYQLQFKPVALPAFSFFEIGTKGGMLFEE